MTIIFSPLKFNYVKPIFCLAENTKKKQNYVAKFFPIDTIENKNRIISEIIKIIRVKRPTIANFNAYSLTDFLGRNNVTIFTEFLRNGSLADIFNKNKKDVLNYNFNNTDRQIILIGISHENEMPT